MFPKTFLRPLVVSSFIACLVAFALVPAKAQNSPSRPQIVAPVDDAVRVTIPQSMHPLARPAFDIGPLDGATALQRMVLVLGGSPDQEYQARTLIDSQHTGGSPNYHHWLTPEDFGQKFGPSPQDIGQVTNWLQQHGFAVSSVAKSGRWIEFSGTSAQVETAFQTQMRQYMVQGELHVANATNISIPAALTPVVRGVLSLHNFHSKPMLQRSHQKTPVTLDRTRPNITASNGFHAVTPGDLATIYNLTPLFNGSTSLGTVNGTGQTIAIVAVSNINTTANNGVDDVAAFQTAFGLPVHDPTIILNGPDPGIGGASDEASLDVEYSGAIAPNATIDLVVSGGSLTTDPVALSSSFIVDQNLAPIINVSFGICEQGLGSQGNAFWNALWEQAAAQGISVFVSSGDTGAAGCDPNIGSSTTAAQGGLGVNGFGSTAFNTAVGGTEFNETVNGGIAATFWSPANGANFASAIGYIPEMVWNESCSPTTANSICQQNDFFVFASGGGGVSTVWAVPSYQTLNIQGLTGAGFPNRPVPDVSLTAADNHDPYIFCFSPDPTQPDCQINGNQATFNNLAGGTSFSSPDFAGIMALVDQAAQNPAAGNRQGLANYVLYSLAATESPNFGGCNSSSQTNPAIRPGSQCVFNDVTAGSNGIPGNDTLSAFVPPEDGDQSGQTGYNAGSGYDPAIGLGSVNATTLVTNWVAASKNFQGSVTTLSSSPATINITHGMPVQFTINVTKNPTGSGPTGNVAVVTSQAAPQAGTFSVGAGTLSGGTFTGSFNDLPGGTYNVTAHYPGDGKFAGSDSVAIPATVAAEATTTTLQSLIFNANTGQVTSGTTVGYGDPVNILVIDADTLGNSGLLPSSGNVSFTDNGNAFTQIGIDNSGIGEIADCLSANCLTIGTHAIIGTYSGDAIPPLSYNGSASGSITITVTKGTPIPAIATLATAGAGVPFTVNVQIQTLGTIVPTGTVQLLDGATPLGGPVTLSGGTASPQVTLTAGGMHNLTAQYSGDTTYNSATSTPAVVTVAAPFNFTATASSVTIAAGANATFNLTLSGVGGFSGQVNFSCTGAPGGATCAVSPGSATLSSATTSAPLTVTVSNTTNAHLTAPPRPLKALPFVFAGILAAGMFGLRRKPKQRILLCLGLFLIAGVVACGGGGSNPTPKPPTNATLTVMGTSGSTTSQIQLTLTVTH
jgi:hypothetical protein